MRTCLLSLNVNCTALRTAKCYYSYDLYRFLQLSIASDAEHKLKQTLGKKTTTEIPSYSYSSPYLSTPKISSRFVFLTIHTVAIKDH